MGLIDSNGTLLQPWLFAWGAVHSQYLKQVWNGADFYECLMPRCSSWLIYLALWSSTLHRTHLHVPITTLVFPSHSTCLFVPHRSAPVLALLFSSTCHRRRLKWLDQSQGHSDPIHTCRSVSTIVHNGTCFSVNKCAKNKDETWKQKECS